jgi:hypothetical protein
VNWQFVNVSAETGRDDNSERFLGRTPGGVLLRRLSCAKPTLENPGRLIQPPCPKFPPRSHHGQQVVCVVWRDSICRSSFANSETSMKHDPLLAVIVAGCANFSVLLFRPSITSELPDLALAGLWFVAVFLVVYGLMRVFRRKRRT